ncbi:hypothetical protein KFK09_002761 [Dendrobium nobile]|uniref:Uncharacterized protein n=1 Tax=Dendrobium nobile TaxID=94219 RepID=A0A8T3C7S9_DENNO|nr:hypothetical protein KFK09_002761 [Dendrobium nobile]
MACPLIYLSELDFPPRIVQDDFGLSWDDQCMAKSREQGDDVAIGRADQTKVISKSARFEERENHLIFYKISEEREREGIKEKSWISEAAERFLSVAAVGESVDLAVRAREQKLGIDPDLQTVINWRIIDNSGKWPIFASDISSYCSSFVTE